jgi:hypothetical protein
MTLAQQDLEDLEDLDPSILDRLPPDVRDKIDQGLLDKLPEDVVDGLPDGVQGRIPSGLIDAAGGNPTLAAVLVVAGILGVLGFFYGVAKSAFKAVGFFGLVAAIAWYWFVNR